ncbi:WAS/WASL-interacting protein family member 1-like isoform X2 [Dreissena polymorpha]|uniref:WAS/WASL-interacting protein family member 1-like isoform X2 n=1 Tax=Dreissena polymorpha TaxID=45954 RepID=UPI002263FF70|nr:WAS/WASL-interacting protein family member 1-like isoform X2 [Dreissena polymorpha]
MKMTSMMSRQQISEPPPPLPNRGTGHAPSPIRNGIASSPSIARPTERRRTHSEAPPPPPVNTMHKSSSTGSHKMTTAADAPPPLPVRGDRKPIADLDPSRAHPRKSLAKANDIHRAKTMPRMRHSVDHGVSPGFPPALPSRGSQGKVVSINTPNNETDDSPPPPPPVARMPSRHHPADPLPPPPPLSKIPTNHHEHSSPASYQTPPRPPKVAAQASVDSHDLENRFTFHSPQDFPTPEPMDNKVKKYPSSTKQNNKVSKSRPGQL